ncbi:helix-turn-helix domain-containing protein [Streptomyces pseudogriseolus]|uniref:AlbA family DNA-binding domain-containing protein n=1 Tax=Streptomyces pseudogriseolus TaxID=36817 RepID=UPI0034781707
MVTRLRRLEGLLGGRLNDVDYSSIAELVGNTDAAEGEDLDYKRERYDSGNEGREELAKDVAAFANHTGGLLVLGMAEKKGVRSRVFDVDLDDRHLRHIRQVIATGYPETGLITRSGQLHPSQFTQRISGAVKQWARQNGLL